MMTFPRIDLGVEDGKLAVTPANTDSIHLKMGVANNGTPNIIYSFTSAKDAVNVFGISPLAESVASAIAEGASPVYATRVPTGAAGTRGTVTKTGTGTATLTAAGNPLDAYQVRIKITRAAASLAAAATAYVLSLDGGDTYGQETAVPVSGVIAIAGTGLTVTFATGTFVVDDLYAFDCTAPSMILLDINTAFDAVLADTREWRFVHIVGVADATLAAAMQIKANTAFASARYTRVVLEARGQASTEDNAQWQAALISEWAGFSSAEGRVLVCAGEIELVSPITARVNRVNMARWFTGRIARRAISEDAGRVRTGPAAGITRLIHDEAVTPGLDAANFTTMRSWVGRAGYFCTHAKTRAPVGSDYTFLQNGFVIDKACKLARNRALDYINEKFVIDPTTGFIDDTFATGLETDVNGAVRSGLIDPQDAIASAIFVKRNVNLLSTPELPMDVEVTPYAYPKRFKITVGLVNPILRPQVPAAQPGQQAAGGEG